MHIFFFPKVKYFPGLVSPPSSTHCNTKCTFFELWCHRVFWWWCRGDGGRTVVGSDIAPGYKMFLVQKVSLFRVLYGGQWQQRQEVKKETVSSVKFVTVNRAHIMCYLHTAYFLECNILCTQNLHRNSLQPGRGTQLILHTVVKHAQAARGYLVFLHDL